MRRSKAVIYNGACHHTVERAGDVDSTTQLKSVIKPSLSLKPMLEATVSEHPLCMLHSSSSYPGVLSDAEHQTGTHSVFVSDHRPLPPSVLLRLRSRAGCGDHHGDEMSPPDNRGAPCVMRAVRPETTPAPNCGVDEEKVGDGWLNEKWGRRCVATGVD